MFQLGKQPAASTQSATKRRTQSPKRTAGSSPKSSAPLINLKFSCGKWKMDENGPWLDNLPLKMVLFYSFFHQITVPEARP
jgi:hypothetical protein